MRHVGQDPKDVFHNYIAFATRTFRQNWYYRGTQIFSEGGLNWISSRTNRSVSTLRVSLFGGDFVRSCLNSPLREEHHAFQTLWEVHAKSLLQRAFSALSNSFFCIVFPILDRILLDETIATAYEPVQGVSPSTRHLSARACLLAAFAILSHLKTFEEALPLPDCQVCAAMAQSQLDLLHSPPSLENLQTVLLLVSPCLASSLHRQTIRVSPSPLAKV